MIAAIGIESYTGSAEYDGGDLAERASDARFAPNRCRERTAAHPGESAVRLNAATVATGSLAHHLTDST
jgi:hypothetical protein